MYSGAFTTPVYRPNVTFATTLVAPDNQIAALDRLKGRRAFRFEERLAKYSGPSQKKHALWTVYARCGAFEQSNPILVGTAQM